MSHLGLPHFQQSASAEGLPTYPVLYITAALLTACFTVVTSQYFCYVIIIMILRLGQGIINIVPIKSTVTLLNNITLVIKLAAPSIKTLLHPKQSYMYVHSLDYILITNLMH